MEGCASSRRVALWVSAMLLTVSLFCVSTWADKAPVLLVVFKGVAGNLSVDGAVASLLYMQFMTVDEHVRLIPHDGSASTADYIKTLLEEEKEKERNVKVVYLGLSPDERGKGGVAECEMLLKQLQGGGKGGLESVEVFDNHLGGDLQSNQNIKWHLERECSSQKIAKMIDVENEEEMNYYIPLVEFAAFIEMGGSEEGKNAKNKLVARYSSLGEEYGLTGTDLTYFVATNFDVVFQDKFHKAVSELPQRLLREMPWWSRWFYSIFYCCFPSNSWWFCIAVGCREQLNAFVRVFYKSYIKNMPRIFSEERVTAFYKEFPREGLLPEGVATKFSLAGEANIVVLYWETLENGMSANVRMHKLMEEAEADVFVSRTSVSAVYSVRHREAAENASKQMGTQMEAMGGVNICDHPAFTQIKMVELDAEKAFQKFIKDHEVFKKPSQENPTL
eukprot:GHVS01035046.1.p1 GENE.GHVS01035046.1~~GHVS01035046.1.p1  ORF type:complete len:447 (+),score=56.61 GHVS01035046.1:84-1424(+)